MKVPGWLKRTSLFRHEEPNVDHELIQEQRALQTHLRREDELRRRVEALERVVDIIRPEEGKDR